jgi:hypothetical protein
VEDHHIPEATSIVSSSLSSAVSSIAQPAQSYGINAGLTSATPPGQSTNGGSMQAGVRKKSGIN